MSNKIVHFTPFENDVSPLDLPEQFNYPFYYEPHELSKIAASELQNYIQYQKEWIHDFGDENDHDSFSIGKMFGVLVVQTLDGELGYLSAFSGKLADKNQFDRFVPPVYDMLEEGNFFLVGMKHLNALQEKIKSIERKAEFISLTALKKKNSTQSKQEINSLKTNIKAAKKDRKRKRLEAKEHLSNDDYIELIEKLAHQSQRERIQLKTIIQNWNIKLKEIDQELEKYTTQIDQLKSDRKTLSNNLQNQLFEQYTFLNKKGENKSLKNIFIDKPPVAGAGECAAPKLLQYAYLHQLEPICMAEFWWGKSPKSSIRKHGHFYPACNSKCKPILGHMLTGMNVEQNPLLSKKPNPQPLELLYEDEHMVIVNKPSGLLSVPGKQLKDSVENRVKILFPEASGPFIVHRLDMATSGILILSKTKEANIHLQQQFTNRIIKKRYTALLDGYLKKNKGIIDLPIRVDLEDRPRQLVCFEHGKSAQTKWEIISRKNNQTKVHFYPITGRSHQLRVHAAHQNGLNHPIVGDVLYGTRDQRLYLHADRVEFIHPITKQELVISCESPF